MISNIAKIDNFYTHQYKWWHFCFNQGNIQLHIIDFTTPIELFIYSYLEKTTPIKDLYAVDIEEE